MVEDTSQASQKHKTPNSILLMMICVATAVFLAMWAILATFFGKELATLITVVPASFAHPFIMSRWESIKIQPDASWSNYIKRLELKFWKVALVFLTMFLIQRLINYLLELYDVTMRPDFISSLPEDSIESYAAYMSDPLTVMVNIASIVISYFSGGYVAGRISRNGYLAPYTHAAMATTVIFLVNIAATWNFMCECFTQENGGYVILWMLPCVLFSILGIRVAIGKPIFPSRKKSTKPLSLKPITERGNIQDKQQAIKPNRGKKSPSPLSNKAKRKGRR